ncbi:MAG: wapA 2 [Anaerocolumna sp.]|jgi:RHS repeat-associated protein|nr:wapA 2 [Anaerocolumna sp.]
MLRKSLKKTIAYLLCITILSSTLKVAEVSATEVYQNEITNKPVTTNPIADETVIFAAAYMEELACIKGLWEHERIATSEIYVRYDNSINFILLSKTNNKDVDIPVAVFNESIDMRVVIYTNDGQSLKSDIITIQKNGESYDIIKKDSDGDGILDGYEIWDVNTDPFNPDTDGDGFLDGYEVNILGTSPLEVTADVDSDGDGLTNLEELRLGSHPYLSDSDFDGVMDLVDSNSLITDYKSNSKAEYNIKYHTGEYDKTYQYTNADNDLCTVIINQLTKSVKYYKVGNTLEVFYYYNSDNNMIAQVNKKEDNFSANTYAYEGNNLIFIGNEGIAYHFNYNDNGDIIQTRIGEQIIANHQYINSSPVRTTLANNQILEYGYDSNNGNITEFNVNGKLYYQNQYDHNGNLSVQHDWKNDVKYNYSYNSENQLINIDASNGFDIGYSSSAGTQNISYTLDGIRKIQSIVYNEDDYVTNLLTGGQIKILQKEGNDEKSVVLTNAQGNKIFETVYTKENNIITATTNNSNIQAYEFDSNGNAIRIWRDGEEILNYKYNAQNQLIQSINLSTKETVEYSYDNNNNITTENHYENNKISPENLIESNRYEYIDPNWGDLLTSYNGQKIVYDAIGNPLEYINDMSMKWDNGRELATINKPGLDIAYTYNSEGLRVKKVVNGVETNYLLDGSKIIAEETNENKIWYSYDSNDFAIGFEYNGENYYYGKNIQNDVICIYSNDGGIVVEYTYDDWGRVIEMKGDEELGNLNKFRYRTYYQDDESGLYYLQSRYYDSEMGRFINADRELASFNAFAYCNNNPINYVDYTGEDGGITYFIISLMFIGFLALAAFLMAVNFITLWQEYYAPKISQLLGSLASMGSAITNTILQGVWNSANSVSSYIASKLRDYTVAPSFSSEYQVHHIVAEFAGAAEPARVILRKTDVNIDVNSIYNLVPIKSGVHAHLHTALYYNFVNSYIINAYYAGSTSNGYNNVVWALNELRVFLQAISAGAPF